MKKFPLKQTIPGDVPRRRFLTDYILPELSQAQSDYSREGGKGIFSGISYFYPAMRELSSVLVEFPDQNDAVPLGLLARTKGRKVKNSDVVAMLTVYEADRSVAPGAPPILQDDNAVKYPSYRLDFDDRERLTELALTNNDGELLDILNEAGANRSIKLRQWVHENRSEYPEIEASFIDMDNLNGARIRSQLLDSLGAIELGRLNKIFSNARKEIEEKNLGERREKEALEALSFFIAELYKVVDRYTDMIQGKDWNDKVKLLHGSRYPARTVGIVLQAVTRDMSPSDWKTAEPILELIPIEKLREHFDRLNETATPEAKMANEEVYERIREINKNDDRVYTLEELAEADIDPEKEFFITKTVRTISAEKNDRTGDYELHQLVEVTTSDGVSCRSQVISMDKDGTINRCEAELDVDGSVAVLDGVRREDLSRGEDIRLFTDQKSKNRSDESEKEEELVLER